MGMLDDIIIEDARGNKGRVVTAPGPRHGTRTIFTDAVIPEEDIPRPPTQGEDIWQGIKSGARRGLEGFVGQFGDLNEAGQAGGQVARRYSRPDAPEYRHKAVDRLAREVPLFPGAPTTQDVRGFTNDVAGPTDRPVTPAGRMAERVSEFGPALASPGTWPRRFAQFAVPAGVSEAAGAAAEYMGKGEHAEWARLAGALAGSTISPGGRSTVTADMARRGARAHPMSRGNLRDQITRHYGALRNRGIVYDTNSFGQTLLDLTRNLRNDGFFETVPEVRDYLSALNQRFRPGGQGGDPLDWNAVEGMVQRAGDAARDAAITNPKAATAWNRIDDALTGFQLQAPYIATRGQIPREEMAELIATGRTLALRNIKQRELDKIARKADWYTSGDLSGLRNQINSMMRNERTGRMFSAAEQEALQQIANGDKPLRYLSKFGLNLNPGSGSANIVPTMSNVFTGSTAGGVASALGVDPMTAGMLAGSVGGGGAIMGGLADSLAQSRARGRFEDVGGAIRSGELTADALQAEEVNQMIRRILAGDVSLNATWPEGDDETQRAMP